MLTGADSVLVCIHVTVSMPAPGGVLLSLMAHLSLQSCKAMQDVLGALASQRKGNR